MLNTDILKYVFAEAAKSNVEKRKVGCIIVGANGQILATGFNKVSDDQNTHWHAETNALNALLEQELDVNMATLTVYVSHPPCPDCAFALTKAGLTAVEVVEELLKFDSDKLRFDLIPPVSEAEIAKVLTDGAKKYKPNNWRNCTDLSRYEAALKRHLNAYSRGELMDKDSGSPHMAHIATNAIFIMELTTAAERSEKF